MDSIVRIQSNKNDSVYQVFDTKIAVTTRSGTKYIELPVDPSDTSGRINQDNSFSRKNSLTIQPASNLEIINRDHTISEFCSVSMIPSFYCLFESVAAVFAMLSGTAPTPPKTKVPHVCFVLIYSF